MMLPIELDVLPSSAELPSSDDMPVDNEDQNLLPNLLLLLLSHLWSERMDWYFGVDMAIYHATAVNPRIPIVPDAFLSIGVERKKGGKSRRSYVVWEESDIVPILTLEMVSHQPGGEYDEKMNIYARMGVLYYVIYNPEFSSRDGHEPLEVYKLINGAYQLQTVEPYWMPEIGLGIGRAQMSFGNIVAEQLTWFDETGTRHLSEAELERRRAESERQRAESERQQKELESQRREQLEAFLKAQGFDPDRLS
jgi:Uma2 family endonuclease